MKAGKIFTVIISVASILIIAYLSARFSVEEITNFIKSMGFVAPLVYIIIQILGQIFAPLSTSAFFIAGYIIFGDIAVLYAVLVWMITSTTNFYISRKYGKRALRFFVGEDGLKRVEGIVDRINNKSLVLLRISTIYINDFAAYAFGLTKISYKAFILSTMVGIVPWAIILTLFLKVEEDKVFISLLKVLISMIPFAILSWIFFKKKE